MERDPVCGMEVERSDATARSDYQGRTYYFCSEACKSDFDSDPEKYLRNEGVA